MPIQPEASNDQWRCFAYLTADKAELYRAIVDVFAAAKTEFVLHLRPAEILRQLAAPGVKAGLEEVEAALEQLEAWGNLQSYKDTADVQTLKDFYRKKLLYQLSAHGEAACAATVLFEQRLSEQAKLDARALERIADAAAQLVRLVSDERVDGPVVLTTLRNICQDADELTQRAQAFFRWLHEQTESEQAELAAFVHYKEQLIAYLQQFIGELIARGGEIASRLMEIDMQAYARLADVAAEEEVGEPRAGEVEQHQEAVAQARRAWRSRLLGLYGWFVGREARPPQSVQLRAAARAAIPRLLLVASQINERRTSRSNRQADFRRLALWFANAPSDAAAHRLFRAAFVTSPARHLRIDMPTLEQRDQSHLPAGASWLDAPPIEVAPQLRKTGRQPAGSATRRIVDRASARAEAMRRLTVETSRDDSSRETLMALGRLRLSEVDRLDADALRLLLELLERAAPRPGGDGSAWAVSRDGRLRITVRPVAEPRVALLRTNDGGLYLEDLWLEVTSAGAS